MAPTHEVLNQPPPLGDYNLYLADPVLDTAVAVEGGKESRDALVRFGELVGTTEVREWGEQANRYPPELRTHDRYGNRVDQVDFHPSWHSLLDLGIGHGVHSLAWEDDAPEASHVVRAAMAFMAWQIEAGHACPVSMTHWVVPVLRTTSDMAGEWVPRLLARNYDPRFLPAAEKTGALMGMGMTEKQGGSDVRSNTTVAAPIRGEGEYLLTGHKWFTSAPMCDAFLVLAQAPGGLSCFLLPRFTPDGQVNHIRIQRLKDKLGNRSNASSEIEMEGAWARMVGEEGRGVATIIEMVNGTRLDCVIGAAALMRQAVTLAGWHVAHRAAFGGLLIDKPLMQNVITDLEVETEVSTLLMTRLARAFDRAGDDPHEAAIQRLALPVAKYWVTKRTTEVVREALECLGGNGYVEDSSMPRLFRESPLNAIWEGSGNVIALDVLRAISRSPESLEAFMTELELARGADPSLDNTIDRVGDAVAGIKDPEGEARRIVETMAVAWAGSLLARHGDEHVFAAFARSRLAGDHGYLFGTLPPGVPVADIARRAVPHG